MKSCSKCKELKPLTQFSKDKRAIIGYTSHCKDCCKEYRITNSDKLKERKKEYRKTNADKIKEYHKEYYKEYRNYKRDELKLYNNKYITERKKRDPLYKLKHNTGTLILNSIKNNGYTKKSRTYEILGCSYEQFKSHIESQFTEGMNWDNRNLWHLDHIIPVSYGLNEEEILALNHYTNFQPLWAIDNLAKGNRYIG